MPKILADKKNFYHLFGKQFGSLKYNSNHIIDNFQELEDLAFSFGIEVEMDEDEQKIAFELPANRPDLLSIENLTYCLRLYLGTTPIRKFTFLPQREKIIVKNNTKQIRPFIVGAVLRNVTMTQQIFDSFMDVQDKLHQNYCRKRKLVAIGTHDLDTIKGPFIYDARPPSEIVFKALKQTEELDCVELFKKLEHDQYLRPYLPIISNSPVYPVILDSQNIVLSLPPIINGEHSKISLNTKNIFIESTATDIQRAQNTLNSLISGFAQYCSEPFTCEMLEIFYESDNHTCITPEVTERVLPVEVNYINKILGVDLKPEDQVKLLFKMGIESVADNQILNVTIPFSRNDILQACDVAEDIGIAYGYNNIEMLIPQSLTVGGEYNLNKMSDMIREECATCGFIECLNFVLCSFDENTKMLNRKDQNTIVSIANSKTAEFQCARTTLLTPILKTLQTNARSKLPVQLFEVGDVVVKGVKSQLQGFREGDGQVGAINQRRLCAVISDSNASELEVIHGLLDQLMIKLKVPYKKDEGYHLDKSNDPCFFPQLQASILYKGKQIGVMGVLHPIVLQNFDWQYPASAIEINLEELLHDFK